MVLSAEGRTILIKTVEGGQLLFASQIYVFIISILYSFLRVWVVVVSGWSAAGQE